MFPAVPAEPPQIPDYQLLRLVGHGAYGDVWLARGLTGVYRAVKVVWRSRFRELQPYEREFNGLREFARVSINEHRQLALLHVGRNDEADFFYYVMELADDVENGRSVIPESYAPLTLNRYLERGRRLPVREVIAHAIELCRALASLHGHGLVHRDIKPSNLILIDGRPKLADIGLVAFASEAVTPVGTEGFVPPEGLGTPAADVFSLGKVVYELAMGRDRNDFPRLPDDLEQRSDRAELMELNEVIVRACDPSPLIRYTDADAMLQELLLLQSGRSVRRLRLTERGLARARRIVFVLGVIAAVGFGGALLERQRAEMEASGRRSAEAERDQLSRLTLYSGGLSRAQRALETGDYGRARELLRELIPVDPHSEDLRGFEWRALWYQAQGDTAHIVRDRGPSVDRAYFSHDAKRFVIHDISKTAIVYDAKTLQLKQTVRNIHRLAGFSADGEWLLGITPEYLLQAWNVESSLPFGRPQGVIGNFPLMPLSGPGMQMLILTVADPRQSLHLRVWDFAEQRELKSWPLARPVSSLWEFRVADTAQRGSLCSLMLQLGWASSSQFQHLLIDLESASLPDHWPTPVHSVPLSATTHAQNILKAAFPSDHSKRTEDRSPSTSGSVPGTSEINAIALSVDQRQFAVGTRRGSVRLFDAATQHESHILRGQVGGVTTIAWSPDNTRLLTADNAGHVRKWDLPIVPIVNVVDGLDVASHASRRVSFSADSSRLAVSLGNDRIGLFETSTLQRQKVLTQAAYPLGFTAEGAFLSVGSNGLIQQWCPLGELVEEINLAWTTGATAAVAFQPQGHTIVAVSSLAELTTRRVDDDSSNHRRLQLRSSRVSSLALSPDARFASAVLEGVTVKIWSTSDLLEAFSQRFAAPVEELGFSPDGSLMSVSISNGELALIDLQTFKIARTIRVSGAAPSAIFSPDASRLVCATRTGLLHIYRTSDCREVATLENGANPSEEDVTVAAMAFSPDGKTLAIHRQNGQLRLWRAP